LPAEPREASEIAIARQRFITIDDQQRVTISWLRDAHGLGMVPRGAPQSDRYHDDLFDPAKFAAIKKKYLAPTPTATSRRLSVVAKLLADGKIPGPGGIPWLEFRRLVKEAGGGSWDVKTLRTDVRNLPTAK
jgi:hypothetical protein